jgi:hypothetical protein
MRPTADNVPPVGLADKAAALTGLVRGGKLQEGFWLAPEGARAAAKGRCVQVSAPTPHIGRWTPFPSDERGLPLSHGRDTFEAALAEDAPRSPKSA